MKKNMFIKSAAVLALLGIGGIGGCFVHKLYIQEQEKAAWSDMVNLSWKVQSFRDHIQSLDKKHQTEHLQESWPLVQADIADLYKKHKHTSFAFCFLYFKSSLVFESTQNLDFAFELFRDAWNKLAAEDMPVVYKAL